MSRPDGYPFIGEPTGLNVIVVGAGIGGLACAIECRRKGHKVVVFENAARIMRIGLTFDDETDNDRGHFGSQGNWTS